jgi:hypothetical protein
MSDITQALADIADLCQTLSQTLSYHGNILPTHLRQLQDLHQRLTYAVIYGEGAPTPAVERSSKQTEPNTRVLVARRCGIEGCQGGPRLWNIAAGQLSGAAIWRCLAHIPRDLTFPVALHGDEWKATGRK